VIEIGVQRVSRARSVPAPRALRRWARAALRPGVREARITLRVVPAGEARALNRRYRRRDYAPNVLSFPYTPAPALSGDVVLCAGVVAREARRHGRSPAAHYAHLVVHGVLHLQGYDHLRRRDALAMQRLESVIVGRLGYPDPWRG
jgi:probable rRNA maturation factor